MYCQALGEFRCQKTNTILYKRGNPNDGTDPLACEGADPFTCELIPHKDSHIPTFPYLHQTHNNIHNLNNTHQ